MDKAPTDLRRHSAQTRRRFIIGGLILILAVGSALIAITYGTPAAVCGIAFFLAAMVPVAIVSLFLFFLQWIVGRTEGDSQGKAARKDEKT